MKYIIAIIQPDRIDPVMELLEQKDIHLVTATTVMGRGRQKGISAVYRSTKEIGGLLKKIKLEIAVNDDYVKVAVDAIIQGARLGAEGAIGDGKIFVLELADCIRIRTGERGHEAIG